MKVVTIFLVMLVMICKIAVVALGLYIPPAATPP